MCTAVTVWIARCWHRLAGCLSLTQVSDCFVRPFSVLSPPPVTRRSPAPLLPHTAPTSCSWQIASLLGSSSPTFSRRPEECPWSKWRASSAVSATVVGTPHADRVLSRCITPRTLRYHIVVPVFQIFQAARSMAIHALTQPSRWGGCSRSWGRWKLKGVPR